MSSKDEVDAVLVRRRLGLAGQIVTSASPEYNAATGVVTLTAINVFVLAPLTITGFVWDTDSIYDAHDMPEDGDFITLAAWARTSTVVLTSSVGDTIGFDVDGGAVLSRVSTNATDDTDDLRDQFNADPGYSGTGTATTVAPGYLSILWVAAWPLARAFTDASNGSAAAAGSNDVVQVISGSGDPPSGAEVQGSHGGTVYLDPHARAIQVTYRVATPDGAPLNRWLAPDWSQ